MRNSHKAPKDRTPFLDPQHCFSGEPDACSLTDIAEEDSLLPDVTDAQELCNFKTLRQISPLSSLPLIWLKKLMCPINYQITLTHLWETTNAKDFWTIFKKITKKDRKSEIGALEVDGSIVSQDLEKAEALNDFFTNIGAQLAKPFEDSSESDLDRHIYRITPSIASIPPCSSDFISHNLSKLNPAKATGDDNVSSRELKMVHGTVAQGQIINKSLDSTMYPSAWKIAKLKAAYKKGNTKDRGNYRPLSLLSVAIKVHENKIGSHLDDHIKFHNLSSINQWGFKAGLSTETMLLYLSEKWKEALDNNEVVGTVFIDFKKAFDTKNHKVLLKKLHATGISGSVYELIESYLKDRCQYVEINGKKSKLKLVEVGVPQGSLLGRRLFAIYVNDLPTAAKIGEMHMYADDTTVSVIRDAVDEAIIALNFITEDLNNWLCVIEYLTMNKVITVGLLLQMRENSDAINFVMLPGESDSELSDLDDDDDDDYYCENETGFFQSKYCAEVDDSSEDDNDTSLSLVDDKGKESDIDDDSPGIAAKPKKGKRRIQRNLSFAGAIESLQSPTFWDIDITNHLVEQMHLYSVQKTGKSTNTNRKELEQLIGIMMKIGIVKMPRYQNYWSQSTHFAPIADVMSLNRFKQLRRFLHANDNSKKDEERNKDNNCSRWHYHYLEALKINCRKMEQKEFQSIDEQIVPAKTMFSGIRQYNPKKTQKGVSKTLSGQLCLDLKADGILTAATLCKDRLAGCKLLSDTELKQKGRGSFCFQTDQNTGLSIVKWYDNKPVHLVSTYIGVQADGTVKRYANQLKIPKAKQLSLLGFISEISQSLIKAEKASPAPRSAERPSKRSMKCEEETTPKRGRVPKVALPDIDSRFDQYAHWPEHKEKKNMCRHCKKEYIVRNVHFVYALMDKTIVLVNFISNKNNSKCT
eukprot:gene8587-9505_t